MTNFEERESDIAFPEHVDMVKMRPLPKPAPHWFYERNDGSIIDVAEEEAYLIEKDLNRIRKLRRFGFSDGMAAFNVLKNCGFRPGQMLPIETSKKIQQEAYDAEIAVAKGHWKRPRHKAWHFDDSIKNHENGDSIMRSLGN